MKSSRQKTTSSPHTSLSRTNIYSFFPLPPTVTAQSIPHWLGYNGRGTTKGDFPHSGVYYSFRKFRRRLPFFEDREKVWLTLFEFWQLHSSAVEEENGMGSCVMCICKSWQQSCDNVSPSPPKIGFLGLPWEQNYVFKRTADMRRFHTWNAHTICICGHCWMERNGKNCFWKENQSNGLRKKKFTTHALPYTLGLEIAGNIFFGAIDIFFPLAASFLFWCHSGVLLAIFLSFSFLLFLLFLPPVFAFQQWWTNNNTKREQNKCKKAPWGLPLCGVSFFFSSLLCFSSF